MPFLLFDPIFGFGIYVGATKFDVALGIYWQISASRSR
jgi:hypothetical protein